MMYLKENGDIEEIPNMKPYTRKDLWAMSIIIGSIILAMIYFYFNPTK